jgi:hypothetical protein
VKILIDECVPRPIIKLLPGYEVRTVQEMGWGAFSNGELLRLAEGSFDLFITSDQNIRYQQNLAGRQVAVLTLSTNNLAVIQSNAALIAAAVQSIQPAEFIELALPVNQ